MAKKKKIKIDWKKAKKTWKKAKKTYQQTQNWIQNNINPDVYRGTYTGFDPFGDFYVDQMGTQKKKSKTKKPDVELSPDGKTIIIKL